jgi:hypothetical protein
VALSAFRGVLVAPEDYCQVLRELGDRDKSAPLAFEAFYAALPRAGGGPVDKGRRSRQDGPTRPCKEGFRHWALQGATATQCFPIWRSYQLTRGVALPPSPWGCSSR